jgi:hypothetical protein
MRHLNQPFPWQSNPHRPRLSPGNVSSHHSRNENYPSGSSRSGRLSSGYPTGITEIEFWLDMARSAGGWLGTAAAVIASPYFHAGLIAFAVCWLIIVGEPRRGVLRDPRWSYLGWGIVAVVASVMIATMGYGAIESYIRTQIASRQANVLHDGTNPAAQPQPPDQAFSFQRRLSPDQFRQFVQQAAKLKPDISYVLLVTPPGDNEAWTLYKDFSDAFIRAGIFANLGSMTPSGPDQTGVMILVDDPLNPPEYARKLREGLEIIGIVAPLIKNPVSGKFGPTLFIGPKPL